jgi:sarcosine oxidase subunit beta
MNVTADIVIIGAGIHGASVAYNLALRIPDTKVVVIDSANAAATGATAASAAMVMHQTDDEEVTKLAHLSIQRYASLHEELGVDIGYHRTGSILFSTQRAASQRLTSLAEYQQQLGIDTRVIDGAEAAKLSGGFLDGRDIVTATYCAADGYVLAPLVVRGYLDYAQSRGTTFLPSTTASGIKLRDGRVVGVCVGPREMIATECVINCAGSRARDVGKWIGIDLPIKRSHRNMLLLERTAPYHAGFPIIEDVDTEWYFRAHREGVLMGVGPTSWLNDDHAESEPPYDPAYEDAAAEYLRKRVPSLLPLKKVRGWAGSRPMLDPGITGLREDPDGLPIVGGVAQVGGYYHSCAWGAFGVTLGPIGGELTAQVVCGEKPTVDLAPFGWERFGLHKPLDAAVAA